VKYRRLRWDGHVAKMAETAKYTEIFWETSLGRLRKKYGSIRETG
jgi:hypothetical protein